MSLLDQLELALAVISDLRAIGAAVVVLLVWALFRYVGLVYRKPKALLPRGAGPWGGKGPKAPKAAKAAKAAPAPAIEEEE